MAAGMQLKVSTNDLTNKAIEISNAITAIEREFSNLESSVNASKAYWTGNAGDSGRKYFAEIKPDMDQVLRRLKEHPKELLIMSGNYEAVEAQIMEIAQALPVDVIE